MQVACTFDANLYFFFGFAWVAVVVEWYCVRLVIAPRPTPEVRFPLGRSFFLFFSGLESGPPRLESRPNIMGPGSETEWAGSWPFFCVLELALEYL